MQFRPFTVSVNVVICKYSGPSCSCISRALRYTRLEFFYKIENASQHDWSAPFEWFASISFIYLRNEHIPNPSITNTCPGFFSTVPALDHYSNSGNLDMCINSLYQQWFVRKRRYPIHKIYVYNKIFSSLFLVIIIIIIKQSS